MPLRCSLNGWISLPGIIESGIMSTRRFLVPAIIDDKIVNLGFDESCEKVRRSSVSFRVCRAGNKNI
jgi:hypothetical protein